MAVAIEGLEKLEDMIVRQAEGGHALLIGLPGLAKTKLVETMGPRARRPPHPFDIVDERVTVE
jgi:MoxR-like ATPase